MESTPENPAHREVAPLTPPAPWIGGKHLLAKRLVGRIDAIPHTCYVEPFVGMGGIFFKRTRRPKAEIINDMSGDVANLFRILQRHYPQFMDALRFQIASRAHFQRLVKTEPDTLTDLERAARFLYVQRLSFGGKVAGRTFGTARTRPARFDLTKLAPLLADVHERLCGVTIECLPWEEVLRRYDGAETLFYLDPPYHGCENYYGKGMFARGDFERLAAQLGEIKGRFILSINDAREIRTLFSGFTIEAADTSYSCSKGKRKQVAELIISNAGPGDAP